MEVEMEVDYSGSTEPSFTQLAPKDSPDLMSAVTSTIKSDSTCSTDSIMSCRICKSGGGPDLMPSPCHCKGSMGSIHISCLEEWLTGSIRDSCELCSAPFNVIRTPKFTCIQAILLYLRQKVNILKLFRDLFFLSVSLMNTCILLYMWLMYIFRDLFIALGGNHSEIELVLSTSPVKGVLYFFFFTLCLVFVSINTVDDFRRIFYFYFLPWYTWWKTAVTLKVVVERSNEGKFNDS